MAKLKIGSLFSGYGGLDMAIHEVLGAETAWFCEFDEAPAKTLAHHWPQVPNYRDVTQIDWTQVEPVDIITGGSPCQDLSQAGRRAGMTEGTRSNLWVNMREAIAVIKPRLVVWENVRGALSATATSDSDMEHPERLLGGGSTGYLRALGRVLGDLADLGYDTRWTTLRASDIGAPHHRARVFLIAWPRDSVLHPGHDAGRAELGKQHEVQASGSREPSQGPAHTDCFGLEARQQRPSESGEEIPIANCGGETLSHPSGAGWNGWGATPGQAESRGAHGKPDRCGVGVHWGEYAPAVRRWERVVGPAPAPTEPNSRGNLRLNAAFAEWMMGLPAGHVTAPEIGLTRAEQLKAIGNGVVPQQGAAALRMLLGGVDAAS